MMINDPKTKYGLILSIVLFLVPFICYGDVVTKVGEACLMSPALYNEDLNIWAPQGNNILLITNKDSKYYNVCIINSDGTSFQRLTDDTASSTAATWSKDGSNIYYDSHHQGLDTLWSMDSSGGNKTLLVQAPEYYSVYQFILSPNNTQIAYLLSNYNTKTAKLYVMNADGTQQTELTKAAPNYYGGFSWSNDGTKIIYYRSDGSGTSTHTLHIVTTDNTSDTEFTTVNRSQAPKWQPNGNKILYLQYSTDNQIFSINSDGTGDTQLTSTESYVLNYFWSPNGEKILFETHTDDSKFEIWVMDADGGNKLKLVAFDFFESAFWSADSTKVVYSDLQNIWVTNTDNSNTVKITNNSLPLFNSSPAFNGNYQKLVFSSFYIDKQTINIINTSGSDQREILSTSEQIDGIYWNPKTEQILYTIYTSAGQEEIWSLNSDGTNNIQLATESRCPNFSPDGSIIAYNSNELWTMDANGTNKKQITTTHNYSLPGWSPEGDRIVCDLLSNQNYIYNIYTMKNDGSEQQNITSATESINYHYPSWSHDGTKIAYFLEEAAVDSNNGLWVMDNDGNNKKQLCQSSSGGDTPKWDNAGRIYFFKGDNSISQVFSIKTDGTDLRAESGENEFIVSFALSPEDGKIAYVLNGNIFIKSAAEQIIPSDEVDSNTITIGNNVFNPASGKKANIFIPTGLNDITVKIFTLTGSLVRKFESVTTSSISWNGRNEDGETVASGVYLVILESQEKTQKDKIIILK